MWLRSGIGAVAAVAALVAGGAGSARAASVNLASGNSSTTIDDRNGLTVWRVNGGADNVFLANDFVRIGASGPESNFFAFLGAPTIATLGTNAVELTYSNAALRAVVRYSLTGGATGTFDSVVQQSTTLTNLGTTDLDLHLFRYSDFDLVFDQNSQLDQIRYLSPSSLIQSRVGSNYALLASVGTAPTHYQATSNFTDFYFKFFFDQDGPTTLNDTPGIGTTYPDPARDSAFAFQWDRTLGAGATFAVASTYRFVNNSAVPEPASLALVGLGIGGAAWLTRRRRR